MIILCVFSKYQYGDPSRGISTEYAAFIPAFRKLGYDVVHFDSWNKSNGFNNYAELNKALLEAVDSVNPDVVFTVQRDYEIWLETIQIIKFGGAATISWTTDDSWKYREVSRFVGSAYHSMTTTYSSCIPMYYKDNIKNVLLTQWGVNSDLLKEPLPANLCRYQVSFVGAAHGERKNKIDELARQGIDVVCFGYGWPNGSIDAKDIPKIVRESIISLNFANANKGPNQIKARTYEVPGAGGFLMTEYAQDLEKSYHPDKEIVVFTSMENLVAKVKYFLANPEERNQIALNGFLRTKQEHTYEKRLQEIVEFALASHNKNKHEEIIGTIISTEDLLKQHTASLPIKFTRKGLVFLCRMVFGSEKSIISARRIAFEISWRVFGYQTFTSKGWVGRMFPCE